MFSPIGKKRIILSNYQKAQQTGRPVAEIARESFCKSQSFTSDEWSSSGFGMGYRSMSSICSLSDDDGNCVEGEVISLQFIYLYLTIYCNILLGFKNHS